MRSVVKRVFIAGKRVGKVAIKRWYITLVLVGILGYFFYSQQAKTAKAQEKTYIVETPNLQEVLALSGSIDAEEKVQLHFQFQKVL